MSTPHPPKRYQYRLLPMVGPTGDLEIAMCDGAGMVAAVPHPGDTREQIAVEDWQVVPWSPGHMALLYGFVGWNVRNVAVARPVGNAMWFTVIREEEPHA